MATIAQVVPLTSFISNIGALLWCLAVSVCALTALALRRLGREADKESRRFYVCGALLTAYLLFDDFFMFHDFLARRYLHLHEDVVYVSIALALLAFLLRFRGHILARPCGFLVLALGGLAASMGVDIVFGKTAVYSVHWVFLFEDGFKFLGIAAWAAYFFCSALDTLSASSTA
jgi:hypothetical protein